MPPPGPPTLTRALRAPRYVLSVLEVVTTFVTLAATFGFGRHVLVVVLLSVVPLVVLLATQSLLEGRFHVRPLEALAARGLAGTITAEERHRLAEGLVGFPRRVVYVRFMAWTTTAAVLIALLAVFVELSLLDSLAVAGVCGANGLLFLLLRSLWFRAAAERALWPALGRVDAARYLGRTVRGRLFKASYLPGFFGLLLAGLYHWAFLELSPERVRIVFATILPLVTLVASLYARALFRATVPIREHLAGRPLTGGGDGPFKLTGAHVDPGPLAALQAATRLPYVSSLWSVSAWAIAGLVLATEHLLFGEPWAEAVLLFAGLVAVSMAAALIQLGWSRAVLEPARELCASELGSVSLDALSPKVSVRARFVIAALALSLFMGTFSYATLYLQHRTLVAAAAGTEARAALEALRGALESLPSDPGARDRALETLARTEPMLALIEADRLAWASPAFAALMRESAHFHGTDEVLERARATVATHALDDARRVAVARPWPDLSGAFGLAGLTLFFGVMLALAMGVSVVGARDIADPLRRMREFARRLGRGELDTPAPVAFPDELGELSQTLDRMRLDLRAQLAAVQELNLGLEQKVADRTAALEATMRELQAAQAQVVHAEKIATVGRLAAGVAHEVNNPLNFIQNALGPLEATIADVQAVCARAASGDWTGAEQERRERRLDESIAELTDLLRLMRNGVQRTQGIVRGLRDFSRDDGGEEARELDLRMLVDETLALARHELLEVAVTRDDDADARAIGSPGALGQVVMNLVVNAAQAMNGRGTLAISIRRRGERLVLRVSDTGAGIAPEVLPKIFEPFFTTKAVGQGTGLGLAVVHGIVERHGGTIRVESTVGRGTTFTVELPAAPAATRAHAG